MQDQFIILAQRDVRDVLVEQLQAELAQREELVARLAAEVAGGEQLEGELAELRRRLGQDWSNSSRPPSSNSPYRPPAAEGVRDARPRHGPAAA